LAQTYPNKPLRMVVPFAPGGPTDIVGRAVSQRMTETFGQTVVVDNRAGAGGVVGADLVAKAPPDGYTILLCSTGAMAINPGLMPNMPYDPVRDFAPLSLVVTIPYLLLVNTPSPLQSVKDLIAAARAKPGSINYGSAGVGSTSHLAGELFKSMAKIDMTHVPYKGSAPAATDLIGGQLQTLFDAVAVALPLVRGGKLRALGISTAKRSALVPDVPTISESGVPGYEVATWHGICAPARTPPAVVGALNRAIVAAVNQPDTRQRLVGIGADVVGSTPEEFGRFIKSELAKWSRIIKQSGASAH
ncbi:MAG TPA: tripartite tricarboxylate transporter substrate binding protein, partial [Burkholderiales bacterium]|nr:tripartite tricarboxylate transporter substrate binding protein [Burkholderiales bacterium]